jgi:sugar phosphate isomerase/epimerase
VELTIFPDRPAQLAESAKRHGWTLTGPYHACLIQGDDQLGALAAIQKTLHDAGVSIYASSGVTDGTGHFGYVIYLKEGDHIRAAKLLGG